MSPTPIENLVSIRPTIEACGVSELGFPQPHCIVMLFDDAWDAIHKDGKESDQ